MASKSKVSTASIDSITALTAIFESGASDEVESAIVSLQKEIRAVYLNDSDKNFVGALSVALKSCSEPEEMFIRCLNFSPEAIKPDAAIRGLFLEPDNESLVTQLVALCLAPDNSGKKGIGSKKLNFSSSLIRELKRGLGNSFVTLGARVWELVPDVEKTPGWVAAWVQMSSGFIRKMTKKEKKSSGQEVFDRYLEAIASSPKRHANKLCQFVYVLIDELGQPSTSRFAVLADSEILLRFKEVGGLAAPEDTSSSKSDGAELASVPGFDDLPEDLRKPFQDIIKNLSKFTKSSSGAGKPKAREQDDQISKLTETISNLRRQVENQKERITLFECENNETKKIARQQEEKILAIDNESKNLRQENLELKNKLRVALTDFDYLKRRSESALVQTREQIFLDLDIKLSESWAMTARAIDLVIKGDREPQQIAKFWNRLNNKLWKALGKPDNGAKVDVE